MILNGIDLYRKLPLYMPRSLRNLFCTICVFSNPSYPNALFEKFNTDLNENFVHQNHSIESSTNKCLLEFDKFFKIHGKDCEFFLGEIHKPDYSQEEYNSNENICLNDENLIGEELRTKLNTNQAIAVDSI